MKTYSVFDTERLVPEPPKASERTAFSRDRARVLHSAALRRLADKTQVVGPRDGDTPRTRLTHSLEVAQIACGIGTGLGLDPDLTELAGLTHDIGHPPYGHNGEVALNQVAAECGGFEGNAQTLRILTRLEPKVVDKQGKSAGLNLTRAALAAACKYPFTRDGHRGKYGCYDEDRELLEWIRARATGTTPSIEAQAMDWADDIAYCVHDVEDGIVSGRVDLRVLGDLVELAHLAQTGARSFRGEPEELIDAAGRLCQLEVVADATGFDGTLTSLVALKAMTSQLVGRYVGSTIQATRASGGENLEVPDSIRAEVTLLKTIAVQYVMDESTHVARQDRQRELVFRVFDYLRAGAPGALDPMFAQWWLDAPDDRAKTRVIIDQIASMTESRLERVARGCIDLIDRY